MQTTFAPFYPPTHSRHQYGAPRDSCFVLFQPEFSFARRNIACGHESTVWKNPKTERDVVRVSFLDKAQNYVKRDCDPVNAEFVRQLATTKRAKFAPLFGLHSRAPPATTPPASAAASSETHHEHDHDEPPEAQVYGPSAWQIVKDVKDGG